MEPCKFFHAGPVEALILDCYRLAKYYGRPPDEFLGLPVSRIQNHMRWTSKLIELQQAQQEDNG